MSDFDDFLNGSASVSIGLSADKNKTDFDRFVSGEAQIAELNQSMEIAKSVGLSPDDAARAKALSQRTGIPRQAVEADLDYVQQKVDRAYLVDMVKRRPELRKFLSEADVAKIAMDDVDALTAVTDRVRAFVGGGVITPTGSVISGLAEGNEVLGRWVERGNLQWSPLGMMVRAGSLTAPGVAKVGQAIEDFGKTVDVPEERRIDYVDDALAGAGQVVTQIATALLTGGAGVLATGAAQGIDMQADRARAAGTYGTPAADVGTVLSAPVTAIMEKTALDKIMNMVPPNVKNAVARRFAELATAGGIEAVQEVAEGVVQNIISRVFVDENQKIIEGLDKDAAGGFGGGVAGRALMMALNRGRSLRDRGDVADQTIEQTEQFNQIAEAAAQTKTLPRDPEAFKSLIEGMTDGTAHDTVYIPGEKLEEYFQSQGLTAQELSWIDQDALDAAVATGGDVAIPMAEYLATIAPQHHAGLVKNIRLTEVGMTLEEAESFHASIDDVAADEELRIVEDIERETKARAPGQKVYIDIHDQLIAAGYTPDVAQTYARTQQALFETNAARLGTDAWSLYEPERLHIQREFAAQKLNKKIDNIDMFVADAREYFKRVERNRQASERRRTTDIFGRKSEKKKAATPRPLVNWFAQRGGIDPDSTIARELKAMDITPKNTPKLFRKGGLREIDNIPANEFNPDFDEVVAVEDGAGYVDRNWFIEMLRDEAAGKYIRTPEQRAQEQLEANYDDLRNYLGRMDLDLDSPIEDIKAALAAYAAPAVEDGGAVEDVYFQGDVPDGTPYTGETIEVDGVTRATTNSAGNPISRTKEGLEAFWRWFGDSKVVDADGKPLVVYHGSAGKIDWSNRLNPKVERISAFERRTGHRGIGFLGATREVESPSFFFTPNYQTAHSFAANKKHNGSNMGDFVEEVYLSIQNPFDITAKTPAVKKSLKDAGYSDDRIRSTPKENLWEFLDDDTFVDYLKSNGYDGAITNEIVAAKIAGVKENKIVISYAAFSPTQIKSIHNRGTFDANDARILYQSATPVPTPTDTPEFEAWAGENHEIVESDDINEHDFSEDKPYILRVFHGTTHSFEEFNASLRGQKEGQFGAVNYFTSSRDDADGNYTSSGPDLTNRITARAERLVQEMESDPEAFGLQEDSDFEAEARKMAEAELRGETSQVIEVFVKTEKPFVVGGDADKWIALFDHDGIERQAIERVAEDNGVDVAEVRADMDSYEDLINDARWEIEADTQSELFNAIERVAYESDIDAQELYGQLADLVADGDVSHTALESALRQSETLMYAEDPETGDLAGYHLLARIIQEMGFDSIILKNANERFSSMDMTDGTAHVHVFDANNTNIKSVYNRGTWDAGDSRIMYQGGDGPLGSFQPATNTIKLFESANLSTFIHESGHYWLELMGKWSAQASERLANAENMEPEQAAKLRELIDDHAAIMKHLGVEDGQPITREQHEEFARTVEAYFLEGRAPSVELQGAMQRMKDWLLRIYEAIKNLNVNMTPEIRGVLDRMLATEREIYEAERMSQYEFVDIPDATPEESARLNRMQDAATGEASRKLTKKVMEPVRRQREKWYREEWKALADTVRAEIEARPEWRAVILARGSDDVEPVKLDLKALEDKFGTGIRSLLPRGVTTKKDGIDPDIMAENLGLANATALVEVLGGIRDVSIGQLVKAETDKRMFEKYGDPLNDGTIEIEAADAVRNEKRADFLAMELKTLRRLGAEQTARRVAERRVIAEGALDPQAYRSEEAVAETAMERLLAKEAGKAARFSRAMDRAGRRDLERAMDGVDQKVLRAAAKKVIGRLKTRDLTRTAQYARAELKAAELSRKAIVNRDYEAAAFYKYRQILNHWLFIEAKAAQKEAESITKYLGGLAQKKTIPAMEQGYLEQIHGLLEKFDFKRASQKEVEGRKSFAAWVEEQENAGREIIAPQSLIDKAQMTHYSQVSLDDLRALKDTVKQIDSLGRLKQKLIDAQKEREFAEVVAEATEAIYDNNEAIKDRVNENPSKRDKFLAGLRSADASLLKMEQLFDWLDGGPNGVFNRVIFQRIAEAQHRENDMTVKYTKELNAILKTLDGKRMDERIEVPGIVNKDGYTKIWRRSDIIAVALNLGNENNLERLMHKKGNNLTEQNIKDLIAHLNKQELEAVNKIWELVDTLWPDIAEVEKRVNRIAPEKVEAVPFEVELPDGEVVQMRGGYYPIIYDPTRSNKAARHSEQDSARTFFEGNYVRATTAKGHTKARMDSVGRPIQLDMNLIPRHFAQVIHDITHREVIIDADRFLSDARIQQAVTDVMGQEYAKMFRPWLHSIAGDRNTDPNSLEIWNRAASAFRTNMTAMAMCFRATTMISQVGGLSAGAEMIGQKWLRAGLKEFYGDPRRVFEVADMVMEKSGEMRNRHNNMDRDLRDGIRKLNRDGVISDVQRAGFYGIALVDRAVAMPVWLGAYQKGLAENMGDGEAVAYADKVVRLTQSAGGAKDLSQVQRGKGNEFFKLFTMFYSYFNAMYARERNAVRDFKNSDKGGEDFALLMARSWWLLVLPAIGTQLLTGRGPDDDEDWLTWSALNIITYPFASIPMVRDIMSAAESGYGYKISPVSRGGESILGLGKSIGKLASGEDVDAQRVAGQALDVIGFTTGLPTGQIKTTGNYLWDVLDGDQRPDGILEFARGVTLGPKKD